MPVHRKTSRHPDASEAACADVDCLYPAFCEGSLSVDLATTLYRHIVRCAPCREKVLSYRAFLEQTSATEFVPLPNDDALVTTASSYLARWRALLKAWLDTLYPTTAPATVYRGRNGQTVSEREQTARSRSERPFLEGRDKYVSLVVHRARGRLLGRVDDPDGLPLFPVLIVLENSRNGGPVLNRLDGTFSTDWDPEATGIVCWTPVGGRSHFSFSGN